MAAEEARLSPDGVRLANEVGPGDEVLADPDQLHRILVNLFRNAREAIEHQEGRTDPGLVRVWLAQIEGSSVVGVVDNGPGLPAGFRVETDSHVGLDVVRTLAERDLNGSFSLTSENGVLAEVRFLF